MISIEIKNTVDSRIKLAIVKGSMDTIKMNIITEKITEEMQKGAANFIFDMQGLTFINSAGMMDILMCKEMIKEHKGNISFFGFSESTLKMLSTLGISKLLTICNNQNECNTFILNSFER